ncbi:SRPBCC family protein [Halegenticoccus soli]|uniref:SRPBCC family protein n=1 Tax=Halegenticoccus soli TaxID=1985678 RepID=UPI000C6DAF2E|nr:SRPBCC family protein [Halegenticoccus soli]
MTATVTFQMVVDGIELAVHQARSPMRSLPPPKPIRLARSRTSLTLWGPETMVETSETSLTIRRTFDSPRERVFRVFVDLDELEAWQSIGDLSIEAHTLDAESAGSFPVSYFSGNDRFDSEGEFLEVVKGERLAYTLREVDGRYDVVESQITVEFRDVSEGTEIVVTQEQVDPEMGNGLKGCGTDRTRT